jgi:hypothetical protein
LERGARLTIATAVNHVARKAADAGPHVRIAALA